MHRMSGYGGNRPRINPEALRRIPRWAKIALLLIVLVVIVVVLLLAALVVLIVAKILNGGKLPGLLEGLNKFIQDNLQAIQPLLDTWNSLQNLFGG